MTGGAGPESEARRPLPLDVSRETLERLDRIAALVTKWTARINLVAPSTLPHLWQRHVLDSAQLYPLAPACRHWADIGTGGGFPGLVIAAIAAERNPGMRITLVESDQRKATFLRTALRETGLVAEVLDQRVEDIAPLNADTLSARALAPLSHLLGLARRHLHPDGMALFPKGRQAQQEILAARTDWRFDLELLPSLTDTEGHILRLRNIHHA